MARKVQLGYYPTDKIVIDGSILQTAKIDRAGPYNATTGTVIGDNIRSGPWRLYKNNFDSVINGSAFGANSDEVLVFKAGHVPIVSWGQGSYNAAAHSGKSWYAAMRDGYADTEIKAVFARIYALPFGAPVVPVNTTTGSKEPIPGSTKKGVMPSEVVLVPTNHEPNIDAHGSPAEFAAAMKHVMQLHDTWKAANYPAAPVRVKFTVIISNPNNNVFKVCGGLSGGSNWYGIGTVNSIGGDGARPVDYPGWDIYFPGTEVRGVPATPGPASGGNGNSVYFGSKFTQLHNWVYSTATGGGHFSNTTRQLIGEMACRIQTKASSDGTPPDANWPDKWWNDATNGFTRWNADHALPNGDHPLIYACQYIANSILLEDAAHGFGATGNGDNSIIPGAKTYDATFQKGGFDCRPSFTAWRTCLVANGNETLVGLADGVTPGAPTLPSAPAAGQTSTVLNLPAISSPNVALNLYRNGVLDKPNLTGSTVTVALTPNTPLPHDDVFTLKGVGSSSVESAGASAGVTVHWLAGITPKPAAPGKPSVTNAGPDGATWTVPVVAGATGYTWRLDGNVGAPDFTSPGPSITASPIAVGAHTVKAGAFNDGGESVTLSPASDSFTIGNGPDTTAPPVPSNLREIDRDFPDVPKIAWDPVVDPTVAGQVTSGLRDYLIIRTIVATGVTGIIDSVPAGTTQYSDQSAPISALGPTDLLYAVASEDNQRNVSNPCTPIPAQVPQFVTGDEPVAILDLPQQIGVNALFNASLAQSLTSADGSPNVEFHFDFDDEIPDDPALINTPDRQRAYNEFGMYRVTAWVVNAKGVQSQPVSAWVTAIPDDGLTFATGAPKVIPGAPNVASSVNNPLKVHDDNIVALTGRADSVDAVTAGAIDPTSEGEADNPSTQIVQQNDGQLGVRIRASDSADDSAAFIVEDFLKAAIFWVTKYTGVFANDFLSTAYTSATQPTPKKQHSSTIYHFWSHDQMWNAAGDGPPGNMLPFNVAAHENYGADRALSTGGWVDASGAGQSTVAALELDQFTTPTGLRGALLVTKIAAGGNATPCLPGGLFAIPVTAGVAYRALVKVQAASLAASRASAIYVSWYNSSGTFISSSAAGNLTLTSGAATPTLAGWQTAVTPAVTAPAGAAFVQICFTAPTAAGEKFAICGAGLWKDADFPAGNTDWYPPFVPAPVGGFLDGGGRKGDRAFSRNYSDKVLATGGLPHEQVWAATAGGSYTLPASVPLGPVVSQTFSTDSSSTSAGTELVMSGYDVSFTAVAGRKYQVLIQIPIDGTVANDQFSLRARYAVGAVPTASDTNIAANVFAIPGSSTFRTHRDFVGRLDSGAISGTIHISPTLQRTAGTGTAKAAGNSAYSVKVYVDDIGGI